MSSKMVQLRLFLGHKGKTHPEPRSSSLNTCQQNMWKFRLFPQTNHPYLCNISNNNDLKKKKKRTTANMVFKCKYTEQTLITTLFLSFLDNKHPTPNTKWSWFFTYIFIKKTLSFTMWIMIYNKWLCIHYCHIDNIIAEFF